MGSEADDSLDETELVNQLVNHGVLVLSDDDELQLGTDFRNSLDEYESQVSSWDSETIHDELVSLTGFEDEAERFLEIAGDTTEIIAEYFALSEIEDLSHQAKLRSLTVFDSFHDDPPPTEGSPDAFFPVNPERIPFLVNFYNRAIVYVWKHDCSPCDLMREDFNDVFPEVPDDIALFSVYGPDAPRFLYDEYSVDGAPTTLFFLHGTVDSRLRGAFYKRVIKKETEKLRDLDPEVVERARRSS